MRSRCGRVGMSFIEKTEVYKRISVCAAQNVLLPKVAVQYATQQGLAYVGVETGEPMEDPEEAVRNEVSPCITSLGSSLLNSLL